MHTKIHNKACCLCVWIVNIMFMYKDKTNYIYFNSLNLMHTRLKLLYSIVYIRTTICIIASHWNLIWFNQVYLTSRWVLPWGANGGHLCWILFCMTLMWRTCVRVMLYTSNDVVFWSCFFYVVSSTHCFPLTCKMSCKIWVVNYPLYIT